MVVVVRVGGGGGGKTGWEKQAEPRMGLHLFLLYLLFMKKGKEEERTLIFVCPLVCW